MQQPDGGQTSPAGDCTHPFSWGMVPGDLSSPGVTSQGGGSKPSQSGTRTCGRWGENIRDSLCGRPLFALLSFVNLVNYIDKAVVPGGSRELNRFIRQALRTGHPDVFLGLLQSGAILGFCIACPVFARLARSHNPFFLMSAGLWAWCAAAVMSGLAQPMGSYTVLLLTRFLSGLGEASYVTLVPPLITETALPGERGRWLALFYTAMPVGAGLGYYYGSLLATSRLGWPWAFYLEALVTAPLALVCSLVRHHHTTAVPSSPRSETMWSRQDIEDSGDIYDRGRFYKVANVSEAVGNIYAGDEEEAQDLLLGRENRTRTRSASSGHGGAIAEESMDSRLVRALSIVGVGSAEKGNISIPETSVSPLHGGGGTGFEINSRNSGSVQSPHRELSSGVGECDSECGGQTAEGGGARAGGETVTKWYQQGRVRLLSEEDSFCDGEGEEVCETEMETKMGCIEHVPLRSAAINSNNNNNSNNPYGTSATNGSATVSDKGSLTMDILRIVNRPVLCLVVFGAAANAAVKVGLSTFGIGFIMDLELLKSETAAAAAFGGVICAGGFLGTLSGGILLDTVDPHGQLEEGKKLGVVLRQAFWLACGATVFMVAATAQSSAVPFLAIYFVGAVVLFACNPLMNLAVMLASPEDLRPLSLAINSVTVRALGEAPSSALVGALKDALAPHCVGAAEVGSPTAAWVRIARIDSVNTDVGESRVHGGGVRDGGVLADISDACRSEKKGLHMALFVLSAWLLWECIFFALATAVQTGGLRRRKLPVLWTGTSEGVDGDTVRIRQGTCCCNEGTTTAAILDAPTSHAAIGSSDGESSSEESKVQRWRRGLCLRRLRRESSMSSLSLSLEEEGQNQSGSSLEQRLIS